MSATVRQINGYTSERYLRNGNNLARERVTGIQRARMLAAMTEACAEHGAVNVTVAHVVEGAGVSRRTFYELFEDRDDCFLAAVEEAIAQVADVVVYAYGQAQRWHERIRAGMAALLQFLEEEPFIGRLLVVETLAAGGAALSRRNQVLALVIDVVDQGRNEAKGGPGPARLVAEGAVGAVLSVLHARLMERRHAGLAELTGPLMSMVVLPYLGAAAARRELARPAPLVGDGRSRAASNPLKRLDMRLTYRTVRVLMAVAACPGASNRAVGASAGIDDQGQISKLLSRLEKLGLVANEVVPARGAPNAWRLTMRGEEVSGALAERV